MWIRLLSLLSWAHLQLVEPIVRWWEEVVLGSWEEWLLALVRQGFEETTRFLNGIGTWFLSLFSKRSYRDQLRRAWQENSWQQWWGEVATRPSTLNALVASLVAQQQQQNDHGSMPTASPAGISCAAALQAETQKGSAVQQSGRTAWWPRPTRTEGHGMGRLKQRGALLSSRLERPVVFVQQSGMGILDELAKRRHGLIEDAKMASQLAVSRSFELARAMVRAAFFLPVRESLTAGSCHGRRCGGFVDSSPLANEDPSDQGGSAAGISPKIPGGSGGATMLNGASHARGAHKAHLPRSKSAHMSIADMAYQPGAGAGSASASMSRRGLQRSRSYGRLRTGASTFSHHTTEAPSDALSVIRDAGYPHELHTVTTDDGYVLRMERIPRPGARDVVFFMHGVLDTSMAWVSGGVTGSQAFAAWEAGMDVWLGNSRGNSPRQHQDPSRRGWKYWQYNINHMGMYDISAQLDHIHNIKCAELGAGTVTLDLDHLGPLARNFFGRPGSGAVGKRMSGSCNPRAGLQLLPGSAVSPSAAHAAQAGSGLDAVQVGCKGTGRMRPSNSDSNLYRWGSSNSTSTVGRTTLLDMAAPFGSGAAGVADSLSEATTTLIAPVTPKQTSPQQQHLATAPAASCSLTSAGSLGPDVSSQGLLSPMASCDGSKGATGNDGDLAEGADEAELRRRYVHAEERQALGLEPSGAVATEFEVSADIAGLACTEGRRRGAGLSVDGTDVLAAACSSPSARRIAPSAALPPSPPPFVCQNAVTLTVPATTTADSDTGLRAGSSTSAGPAGQTPFAATTFILEAKTRRDFGSGATAAGPQTAAAMGDFGGRQGCSSSAASLEWQQSCGGSTSGDAAGGVGAAATVLDVVNSVLGPAANAVTHAVASAGAAIATAAVSATHLLHPPPQRPSGLAVPPHAAGASVSAAAPSSAASPFADPASQASASSQVVVENTEGQGAECSPAHSHGSAAVESPATGGRERGLLAAAPAATPLAESYGQRQRNSPNSSNPMLLGTSFRRACSSQHLAARAMQPAEDCMLSSGAAAERVPIRLMAAERTGSNFSAASGLSSTGDGATNVGNGAVWGKGLEAAKDSTVSAAVRQAGRGRDGGTGAVAGADGAASKPPCPYKLCCVAHSLGGMSVLIHLINRLREGRPHHVNRLLLLTPAGFHKHCPRAARPVMWALPIIARVLRVFLGSSFCFPLYIPTPLGRALTFKLLLSASRIPGLGELLRLSFKALLDGDISQWDRALQMPHYSAQDMPAISVDQVLHLVQLVNTGAFQLYDYGSPAANVAHYGSPTPPDVSAEYWRLDLPVHLVGGRRDGIIPPANLHRHLEAMKTQGVAVSYREFDFGHLDFTFGVKEELRMYLMKVLRL